MLGVRLHLPGRAAAARRVPELPAEVRLRGRHLLHARMRAGDARSAIDEHADERAGEEVAKQSGRCGEIRLRWHCFRDRLAIGEL
jgi:hypothetical protein